MNYIGIDLGTSSVKLLLVDDEGRLLRQASRDYPLFFPQNGWSEQNPEDWWKGVKSAMRELLDGIDAKTIAAIGCGGQMHGLVILDEKDAVLRPAILWNDGRTQAQTDYLNHEIGTEKLAEWTGNIAFAGFTAPKLLWVEQNEPEIFSRIAKIMLPKDYINYCLSGAHACDYSDASGMLLLDVKNRKWSEPMLDICHLRAEQLPKLCESYEVVGTLLPAVAKELGLSEGVKVVAGAGDNAAAAVGCGVVTGMEASCNLSLGTSGTLFITAPEFAMAPDGAALHAFAHADGRYHLMGCMLSAASCNKWLYEDIFESKDYAGLWNSISEDRLGRNDVFFLPYLMGERSPINDIKARAGFVGMSLASTRADMVQAVLEGVAFGLRDSLECAKLLGVAPKASKLCGGGAKSVLWQRILANVLNLRLELPQTEQGPGYGAAILAMVGDGRFQTVLQACKAFAAVRATVEPEPALVAIYEERYREYSMLYPSLKPFFHREESKK